METVIEKEMKIGIMSREEFRNRTLAIARGEYKPGKDEPKIWFESVQSFAQVLSDDNRSLLRVIEEKKPKSLVELEILTGRKKSNLSRTLHKMADYGIVELVKRTKEVAPIVKANCFNLKVCAY